MNGQEKRIEQLLERYFDATATDAEERELRAYFRQTTDIPASLRCAQALFGGLDALAEERLPERQTAAQPIPETAALPEEQPEARLIPPPERLPRWNFRRMPLFWTAVAAALLLGLFFSVEHFREPYCYIDGVAIYDKEVAMQTTVYLDGFSDFSDPAQMVDELIDKQ